MELVAEDYSSLADEMEVELDTNGLLEDSNFETMGDIDSTSFEHESCGICMDVVIDRGVLDCCQHWFCFVCIDNWATITSLCPLCQKEFHLITCVPVYDTIGSGKVDDDLLTGDEDWSIQGKNNTLSFPSYYIDENAVICLDGDGCKIRSGVVTTEEDPNLDTSIACDSCDLWYHAFCVGFDTEDTSENSWLCPRCVNDEIPLRLEGASEIASHDCSLEIALSTKVSVSVPDAGETAVVISAVERKQESEEPSKKDISALATNEDGRTETFLSYISAYSPSVEALPCVNVQSDIDQHETSLALSLSRDKPVIRDLDGSKDSSGWLSDKALIGSEQFENETKLDLGLGLSLQSALPVDDDIDTTESHVARDIVQPKPSNESSLPVIKVEPDINEDNVGCNRAKRKATSPRDQIDVKEDSERQKGEISRKMETGVTTKKAKFSRELKKTTSKFAVRSSVKEGTRKCSSTAAVSEDDQLRDIVQGINCRPFGGVSCSSSADKSTNVRENGAGGLRVKKIMRRAEEDESSKMMVEGLRKQIREAVRNKEAKDLSTNMLDPKLLEAFRAAIGVRRTEPESIKRLNPSVLRVKKSMLQKGKARENLTKKIYGNTNGRRRRAWDRDWEVEFWKHRCTRMSKSEKVDTLTSVLDLLRKKSDSSEVDYEPEGEVKSSILNRLYLADTSVFPRRDDIKPVSDLTGIANNETASKEVPKRTSENKVGQTPAQIHKNSSAVSGPSIDDKRKKNISNLKVEAGGKKSTDGSKMKAQTLNEKAGNSDAKVDKKKWALEVLARKTAVIERDSTQVVQGESSTLKGNYPLVAQLPADMRPILAQCRHNKVPVSVRQAQLYRMTEHFLKNSNLPVIRRTAETELAVADAVNIEKDAADKSNSKLVYVNLCSQVLRQHVKNSKPKTEPPPEEASAPSPCSENTKPEPEGSDPSVEEALKLAGLISDSPPNSPYRITKDLDHDRPRNEEGPENVFDMDSHPELDIYGDFEYDLEDDNLLGTNILNLSKPQSEEGDLKMKVVFSTLNMEKVDNAPDTKDLDSSETVKAPDDHKDADLGSSELNVKTNSHCPAQEPLQGEIDGELSLAEYEELYGGEKEALAIKLPELKLPEQGKLIGSKDRDIEENATHTSSKAGFGSETESCAENILLGGGNGGCTAQCESSGGENSPKHSTGNKNNQLKDKKVNENKRSEIIHSISKKVETYIKEHIRPLCKSGVITAEQYRYAVTKTTEKVMRYHSKDKNANFLIKEGEKVKKLAEQYVEAAQQKKETR